METKRTFKLKDAYGKEYNITFIHGDLPRSTVAKELATLFTLDINKNKATIDFKPNNLK